MVKTLTKHGNSYAIVIDKPILDLLKIGPKTPLEIATDGKQLVITPTRAGGDDDAFDKALNEVNSEFGTVLRNLAK